ncbi:MAG: ATP-binding protein, partial [Muribaculaceae bacterium]|nr:ATP-binding protein [Muribaculaceae bacterium]
MEKIIGRKQEIAQLKQCYDSGKPEMVIVYGRRRIGKTFLVRETFANQFDFYLTGLFKKSKAKQLENFANVLAEYSGEEIKTPKTWYDAFRMLKHYILSISRPGRKLIFLDEVPWMDTRRSDFVSALENFWN